MTAAVRRSAASHAAILVAAIRVVAERGYAGTTVEAVAAAAGAGKQTIYRWWPNKAALFIEVYGSLVPAHGLEGDTGTLRGDLEALLHRLFRRYADTPAAAVLAGLVAEAQADAGLARQLRDSYVAPRRAIIAGILRRARARGELRAGIHEETASDMISAAVWFRLLAGDPLDAAFAGRLLDHLLGGLAACPP